MKSTSKSFKTVGNEESEIQSVKITLNRTRGGLSDIEDIERTVLSMISVKGNPYCEGRYFKAISEQLLTQFGYIIFLVGDRIQEHNLKNKTWDELNQLRLAGIITQEQRYELMALESAFRQQALNLGAEWIEKHLKYFLEFLNVQTVPQELQDLVEKLKTCQDTKAKNKLADQIIMQINRQASDKFEIVRWQDWSNYNLEKKGEIKQKKLCLSNETFEKIKQLCLSNEKFLACVDQEASDYARRHRICDVFAKDFIIEESTDIMIRSIYNNIYPYYPGRLLSTFIETAKVICSCEPMTLAADYCKSNQVSKTVIHFSESVNSSKKITIAPNPSTKKANTKRISKSIFHTLNQKFETDSQEPQEDMISYANNVFEQAKNAYRKQNNDQLGNELFKLYCQLILKIESIDKVDSKVESIDVARKCHERIIEKVVLIDTARCPERIIKKTFPDYNDSSVDFFTYCNFTVHNTQKCSSLGIK
jgi:hypothetical protein